MKATFINVFWQFSNLFILSKLTALKITVTAFLLYTPLSAPHSCLLSVPDFSCKTMRANHIISSTNLFLIFFCSIIIFSAHSPQCNCIEYLLQVALVWEEMSEKLKRGMTQEWMIMRVCQKKQLSCNKVKRSVWVCVYQKWYPQQIGCVIPGGRVYRGESRLKPHSALFRQLVNILRLDIFSPLSQCTLCKTGSATK